MCSDVGLSVCVAWFCLLVLMYTLLFVREGNKELCMEQEWLRLMVILNEF